MCRLKRWALFALTAGVIACARMEAPPGGPPRFIAPVLLSTFPADTTCVAPLRGDAEFVLDEVVSYGSQPNFGLGTGDIEKLVLLSPDTLIPAVAWQRNRIGVRPRHGWRPNTAYRIELLPGLRDVHPRQNQMKTGGVISFSTGGACPTRSLSGRAVDWATRRGVPQAFVDAIHLPDSLHYRTIADSTGRFVMQRLPDGIFLVRAVIDQNQDHRWQVTESWDTVRAGPGRDSVGEIWAFQRDTFPPKIQTAARQDSNTIAVTFTRPVDPFLRLDSTAMRVVVILPSGDSGSIGPIEAMPKALYDSLHPAVAAHSAAKDSAAVRDSVAKDSARKAEALRPTLTKIIKAPPVVDDSPKEKRPELGTIIVIRTRGKLQLGEKYVIELKGVKLAGGATGNPPLYPFEVPKPTAADSAKAKTDSIAKVKADSIARAKTDSLKTARDTTRKPTRPDSGTPVIPPPVKADTHRVVRHR
ncbi:MAG TPA: carboxypeptidase-like regulatory domain-containing protein [Gemmatimonadales bacterium]|jgi:hypothetical protein